MIKLEATACRHCGHDFVKARKKAEKQEDLRAARKAGMAGCGILVAIPIIWIPMTLASGPSPEAASRVQRQKESGEYCLNMGDGAAHIRELKLRLRDPDSFQHISTTFEPAGESLHRFRTTYRARNGFGGMMIGTATGLVNYDCDVATLDDGDNARAARNAAEESRLAEIKAGGERAMRDGKLRAAASKDPSIQPPSETGRYVVNMMFSACPKPSDWYAMQDAISAGDNSVNLPRQCTRLTAGTRIKAAPKGARPTVTYRGHTYEMGQHENGQPFWTDGMDEMSISSI